MAMYHLTVKNVGRGSVKSAVEAAAYRSGQKLYDKYYGESHDFTRKRGIVHTEILLPHDAPPEFFDRETLWNTVEFAEKRKDARTAREIEVALPMELSHEDNIALVREFVKQHFVELGMCADICIHDKGDGNPHAHILLTTRQVGCNGFSPMKNRDWNKSECVNLWREQWANMQNKELMNKGVKERVTHESYVARGINREPTIHLGPAVNALERRGKHTGFGDKNRAILAHNREREQERQRQRERGRER